MTIKHGIPYQQDSTVREDSNEWQVGLGKDWWGRRD